jgi:hypothetical protein
MIRMVRLHYPHARAGLNRLSRQNAGGRLAKIQQQRRGEGLSPSTPLSRPISTDSFLIPAWRVPQRLNRLGRQPPRRAARTAAGVRASWRCAGICFLRAAAQRGCRQQPGRRLRAIRAGLRPVELRHRAHLAERAAIGAFVVIGRHSDSPSSVVPDTAISTRNEPETGLPAREIDAMLRSTMASRKSPHECKCRSDPVR